MQTTFFKLIKTRVYRFKFNLIFHHVIYLTLFISQITFYLKYFYLLIHILMNLKGTIYINLLIVRDKCSSTKSSIYKRTIWMRLISFIVYVHCTPIILSRLLSILSKTCAKGTRTKKDTIYACRRFDFLVRIRGSRDSLSCEAFESSTLIKEAPA